MSSNRLLVAAIVLAGIAAASLTVAASSGAGARAAASKTVSVRDDFFSPRIVTVRRGGKVTWSWKGFDPHNVTFRRAPAGAARPKRCGTSSRRGHGCTRTFRKRGTFRYVCTIHELAGMTGRVVVK